VTIAVSENDNNRSTAVLEISFFDDLKNERAYPLSLILLPTPGYRDEVFKHTIVFPQLQLLERGSAGKEIENGAYEGLLLRIKRHAGGGLDVGGLGLDGGRHSA